MTPVITRLAAAVPARQADRLAGPRRGVDVVHRGRDALYVDLDGWCLGVVRAPAVAVPCALVVAADAAVDLAGATEVVAGEGQLVVDDASLRVGRFRDVRAPRITGVAPAAVDVVRHHAAPAVAELGGAHDLAGLDALVGRGSGLTPLGDDVLAGWLATSSALTAPALVLSSDRGTRERVEGAGSYDVRGRTTLLSATLVDCAARGEVLPEFAALVGSLADPVATEQAAAALARDGHTSGAGLLLGCALRLAAA